MSLSPFVSFQSRFVTYLLTFPRNYYLLFKINSYQQQRVEMADILRTNLNRVVRQDECLARDLTWSECIRL